MEQINQLLNPSSQMVHIQRGRGRPRKDLSLNRDLAIQPPPGFELQRQFPLQKPDKIEDGGVVGQVVTGVIEASFDNGYLLSLRIGNSHVNLKGVAFKPGYHAPITSETDIATHFQMIGRNDAQFSAKVRGGSSNRKLSTPTSSLLPCKRKYASPIVSPSVPPVGVKGTLVPVVLEPVNLPNRLSSSKPSEASQLLHTMATEGKNEYVSKQLTMFPPNTSIPVSQIFAPTESSTNHQVKGSGQNDPGVISEGTCEKASQIMHTMATEGKNEYMSKQLTMFPPNTSIPVSQIFGPTDSSTNHQVKGSGQNDPGVISEGTCESGPGENLKPINSLSIDAPGLSQPTTAQVTYGSENCMFSPEDLGTESEKETGNFINPYMAQPLQFPYLIQPMFNYGTGRMTDLLKAMQENTKDHQLQIVKNSIFATKIESPANRACETNPKKVAENSMIDMHHQVPWNIDQQPNCYISFSPLEQHPSGRNYFPTV